MKGDEFIHNYQTASYNYGALKQLARENRSNPTECEKRLWKQLQNNRYKFKFRRQHIIGDYIVDLVSLDHRLVIEIDGDYHGDGQQIMEDALRTDELIAQGFEVIRFTNNQVLSDVNNVAERIYDKLFEIEETDNL